MNKIFTFLVLSLTSSIYAQNYNFGWANAHSNSFTSYATSIATDSQDNVYILGKFEGTLDLDPGAGVANVTSNGGHDIFIQKTDTDGNLVWAKSIGGPMNDFGFQITVDNNDNLLIGGSYNDVVDFDPNVGVDNHTSMGFLDAFVLKLTSSGAFEWVASLGSTSSDVAIVLATNSTNEVIIGGTFVGTVDFDPGTGTNNQTATGVGSDAFLLKLDTDGNYIWVDITTGANTEEYRSLAIDDNDNIYAQGVYNGTTDFDPGVGIANETSVGNEDSFIQKLDNNGTLTWARVFGGAGIVFGICHDVDGDGNIYTSGYFTGTADLDPGPGVENVSTGLGQFDSNIFIQKLDASGNLVWGKTIASPSGGEQPADVVVNDAGEIFLTGYCGETTDFDPGAGTHNLTSTGSYDFFLVNLDTNGDFSWAENWGAAMPDYSRAVALDNQGSIFLAGDFQNTVDFDPGAAVYNLVSGGADYFLLKLEPENLGFSNLNNAIELTLYPNPSQNLLTVKTSMKYERLEIINSLGQTLFLSNDNTSVYDVSNLTSGIYWIKLSNSTETATKKFIKK